MTCPVGRSELDQASASGPIYLDLHGGALFTGGGDCCRATGTSTAQRVRMRIWGVDYRMLPDHPFPAALDDCVTVYRALLKERSPQDIVVGGASAGGNLVAAPVGTVLFGGFSPGFPPTLLASGTRDLFLSNAVRMHRALRAAGIPADLHAFEAAPHELMPAGTPEDEQLLQGIHRFIETDCPAVRSGGGRHQTER
ncbi:alpha/beta hydrolase [Streptomyces sp. NBC_01622]|uniref:alpha/beta hydrolase n=1 Tax=Streptomyces sp. NBC_01622 TaxID=2975903 RepID=UPI003864A9AF|nr:alpha/beta hydrolase [Streptomyces sp. NBC_01622]